MVQIPIPKPMRKMIYSQFGSVYGVKYEDMVNDLEDFPNFQEFFTRKVKPRELEGGEDTLLSPADCTVLSVTKVDQNDVLFIKGKTYGICEFLNGDPHCNYSNQDLDHFFKKGKDTELYSMIMYLAPGDYHRFHSPSDFRVEQGKHVPGLLKPVNNLSLNNLQVL